MTRAQVLVIAALALPVSAQAQMGDVFCDDSARLEGRLTERYGARKEARGIRGPDAILNIWITPRTGEWTIVQSYANGTSCIVAMGEDWETLSPVDPS